MSVYCPEMDRGHIQGVVQPHAQCSQGKRLTVRCTQQRNMQYSDKRGIFVPLLEISTVRLISAFPEVQGFFVNRFSSEDRTNTMHLLAHKQPCHFHNHTKEPDGVERRRRGAC